MHARIKWNVKDDSWMTQHGGLGTDPGFGVAHAWANQGIDGLMVSLTKWVTKVEEEE